MLIISGEFYLFDIQQSYENQKYFKFKEYWKKLCQYYRFDIFLNENMQTMCLMLFCFI